MGRRGLCSLQANFSWEECELQIKDVLKKHINDLIVLQLQFNCVKLSQMQSVEFMKSHI